MQADSRHETYSNDLVPLQSLVCQPFQPAFQVSEVQVKIEARLAQPSSKDQLKVLNLLFCPAAVV
jgi:hypothetical protein